MKKALTIDTVQTLAGDSLGTSRLEFTISGEGGTYELWYQVEDPYAPYLCDDRCDAAVVAVIVLAMRAGYDEIRSEIPMSDELWYNLQYHVLPQLATLPSKKESYKPLQLEIPTTATTFHAGESGAVGVGMSLGVDSFATLAEYGQGRGPEGRRITHLTYFRTGAHHGLDWRVGPSPYTPDELFNGHLQKVRRFAETYDYKLVVVDTNIPTFLSKAFIHSEFFHTHTYRNVSAVLALQKLFSRYYYSSALNVTSFAASLLGDSAAYEKWLLPMLDTGSTRFYSSNQAWDRFEKTQRIVEMPESHDYLTVCFTGIENCGRCDKCRKTLMNLDVLGEGVLDQFANTFDVDLYRARDRDDYFGSIYKEARRNGSYGHDARRILDHGLRTDFPFIPEPPLTAVKANSQFASAGGKELRVRKLPFPQARVVETLQGSAMYEVVATYGRWRKIITKNGPGFVHSHAATMLNVEGMPENLTVAGLEETFVYSAPDAGLNPAGQMEAGQTLPALGCKGEWVLVDWLGSPGFVRAGEVELADPGMIPAHGPLPMVETTVPTKIKTSLLPCAEAAPIPAHRRYFVTAKSAAAAAVTDGQASGYVNLAHLAELAPTTYAEPRSATLTEHAALHALPTARSASKARLEKGTPVRVLASLGRWRLVETATGFEGWLRSKELDTEPRKSGRGRRIAGRLKRKLPPAVGRR